MTQVRTNLQKTLLQKLARVKSKQGQKQNLAQKGFTLIELLIVAAILGALLAIILPNIIDSADQAKLNAADTAAKAAALGCVAAILTDDEGSYTTPDNVTATPAACADATAYQADAAAFGITTGPTWTVDGTTATQTGAGAS